MPDYIIGTAFQAAQANAAKKKTLDSIRRVTMNNRCEGLSVQMLHVGPYAAEPETLAALHMYMKEHSLIQNGLHHEIYVSDPRKTAPSKLRTILRLPVMPINPVRGTNGKNHVKNVRTT
ncbi:GyrI-like domain-containing protein [Paenibacillus spongiae]|uniref:GyrI-like domain-containing protein n=1 Tax=Paenibacillus spongiae TaxID=2909671 RepID=A0ABY5SFX5_9BACL|nr:GyrI-like domain-containing protein [Paenibacillus spongiae]UVI31168.1 GyrI-like domain-containing protein [Paenibacillus spongiae]